MCESKKLEGGGGGVGTIKAHPPPPDRIGLRIVFMHAHCIRLCMLETYIYNSVSHTIDFYIIIYLYCRHTVHIHIKKMLNIYKSSNKNNNNIISQSKIVLINITLISTIAEWESEYKQ